MAVFVDEVGRWLCDRYPNDKLLRTYWYDGAKRGVPSAEQLEIAALPFVKFRLGRINAAGQQGEVAALVAGKPKIPRELDAQMLQEATGGPGGHTISDSDRRSMRREFWQTVTHTAEG
ncbi:MAG: hypothetical protein ACYCXA_04105 [Actinomycetes bacterium]